MLLGFDVSDHPRSLSNARSLPGGVNATSHCFGVILALLDSPSFAAVHPHQARLVMEILYRLVSSRFTAERTLQYAVLLYYYRIINKNHHLPNISFFCKKTDSSETVQPFTRTFSRTSFNNKSPPPCLKIPPCSCLHCGNALIC